MMIKAIIEFVYFFIRVHLQERKRRKAEQAIADTPINKKQLIKYLENGLL